MRILHLSDLHLEPIPERRRPGVNASLARDRDQILAARADLTIVSGDLTSYGCSHPAHLALVRDWLDDLGIPYLAVAGNHDLGANTWQAEKDPELSAYEDVPFAETGYGRTFGVEPVVTRDLGLLRVIGASFREYDPDRVLPRLEAHLSVDSRPVLLFTHYPIVEPREPLIDPDFGSSAFVPQTAKALLELVRAHPNVRLYAAGHVHVSSVRQISAHCTQITAGSLGQGASVARVYDIDAEGLTYSTIAGSGPLAFWGSAPDVGFHLGYDDERTGRIDW